MTTLILAFVLHLGKLADLDKGVYFCYGFTAQWCDYTNTAVPEWLDGHDLGFVAYDVRTGDTSKTHGMYTWVGRTDRKWKHYDLPKAGRK